MKVGDRDGRELAVGDRVRAVLGEDREFAVERDGVVAEFAPGPPAVAVRFDDDLPHYPPYWLEVDLMWLCPDLLLADESNDKGDTNAPN